MPQNPRGALPACAGWLDRTETSGLTSAVADDYSWMGFTRQQHVHSRSSSPTSFFFFFLARHNVFRDCIILLYLGYSISTGPDNLTLLRAVSLCVDPKDRAEEMFGGLEGYTQRREPPYLPNN